MVKRKVIKEKQCRVCGYRFIPRATTQIVCGPICAVTLNKRRKQKEFDAETKRLKQTIKTKGDYTEAAQKSVNRYVRARDVKDPCISCGKFITKDMPFGQYDCGHYKTVGAFPALRFEELNASKQCKSCNGGAGNWSIKENSVTKEYRINLINKIGLDKVEWIEGPHEPKKYTCADLKEIELLYKKKLKQL